MGWVQAQVISGGADAEALETNEGLILILWARHKSL